MESSLFFTGYARLPASITAAKLYEVIAVGVEVDSESGVIIAGDCTLATDLAKDFVRRAVTGYNLNDGIDGLTEIMERRYYGSARKALISSLKIIYEKWLDYKFARDTDDSSN